MKATVRPFGEHTILIDWPAFIDEHMHQHILAVNVALKDAFPELLVETVVTYHTVAVYLKEAVPLDECIKDIETFILKNQKTKSVAKRKITIPVCYDDCFALDITIVAEAHNLTKRAVIDLHTSTIYPVYFLGFLPGFPYLGGLDEKLHTARHKTPRLQLPAGAVGIGGSQTGIYPSTSPGGWNIIGKTPLVLFDVTKSPPNLLKAGDYIVFQSISAAQFEEISQEIKAGTFQLKTESL